MSYSRRSDSVAVIEVTSLMTWQKDNTARRSTNDRTELPEYVVAHRKGLGNKAKGCVTV